MPRRNGGSTSVLGSSSNVARPLTSALSGKHAEIQNKEALHQRVKNALAPPSLVRNESVSLAATHEPGRLRGLRVVVKIHIFQRNETQ